MTQGVRKLIAFLGVLAIGAVFTVLGYLEGQEFVELTWKTAGIFFAANGIEHLSDRFSQRRYHEADRPEGKEVW